MHLCFLLLRNGKEYAMLAISLKKYPKKRSGKLKFLFQERISNREMKTNSQAKAYSRSYYLKRTLGFINLATQTHKMTSCKFEPKLTLYPPHCQSKVNVLATPIYT